jgi:putative membrane protein
MRSVRALSEAERSRIEQAIRAAETTTAGEIYVVVAREADPFYLIPVLWAAIFALLLPWPLFLVTTFSAGTILVAQVVAFVVAASIGSLERIRHILVPPSLAASAARSAAINQFMAHGIHLTEQRTGILIYVALYDRRVEIVADVGIHRRVIQADLDKLADDVIQAARNDQLADGLAAAVQDAGDLLAKHFPPSPMDRNELPDRVVEI